jgi:hypothetical protein
VLAKRQPVLDAVKRLYEGPFVIKEVVNVYLYKLQSKSGNIKGLFHISHLKPYVNQTKGYKSVLVVNYLISVKTYKDRKEM